MKSLVFFFTVLTVLFFWSPATGQKAKGKGKSAQKEAAYQSALSIIESGKYEFNATKANPLRGRQIDLTTNPGYLKVKNGHAQADLPYLGVAQNAPYSGDVGIKFDGEVTSYEIDKNEKKNKITVTFKVSDKGESFNCTLTVSGASAATLYINSSRRDSISYFGNISEQKE